MCWICADGEDVKAGCYRPNSAPPVFRFAARSGVSGRVGNYLRVEILWQVGLAPQHKASI
jgi:hypothetical protein